MNLVRQMNFVRQMNLLLIGRNIPLHELSWIAVAVYVWRML